MGRRNRLALAALAVAVILAPAAALHPVAAHLAGAGLANLAAEFTHPELVAFAAAALLLCLPAAGFTLALVRAFRARSRLKALVRHSRPASFAGLRYRALPSEGVQVFTAGILRPALFVTEGAERALSPAQLHAALLHEDAHRRSQDVLWRVLLLAVRRGFAFVPAIRGIVDAAALRAECAADDHALRHGVRRSDLFEAIVAVTVPGPGANAVGLSDGNVELRLRRLVDPGIALPGRPAAGFAALAAAVTLPAAVIHVLALVAAVCTPHVLGW